MTDAGKRIWYAPAVLRTERSKRLPTASVTGSFPRRALVLLASALVLLALATGCGRSVADPDGSRDSAGRPEPESLPGVMENPPVDTSLRATPDTERRNVVQIVLESTRARSVTPYNEEVPTTPFLDRLAGESIFAERAHAVVPHTNKALVAAECGIWPKLEREITEDEQGSIPARCLAGLLGEEGYSTVWFQSGADRRKNRGQMVENFGYDEFYPVGTMEPAGFQRSNYFGYEEAVMLRPSRAWLEENGDEPFLATYKTGTPHNQYLAPARRYGRVDFTDDGPLNRYLNSVRYVDFFMRDLFRQYKDLGLYDDTIFVIYGDHGEGFEEHGRLQHDNVIWEEGLRIPLMVHDPRWESGERVEELSNQLDILPTITSLLGYEMVGGRYPGHSLTDLPENREIRASCWYNERCLTSIRDNDKYIYHYGERREELFDLRADPLEENNLAGGVPEKLLTKRRRSLIEWRENVIAMHEAR